MLAEEIAPGMTVRYPRTGTSGKILRIEQIHGDTFAELDSTNLLYRIDELIPSKTAETTKTTVVEDAKRVISREREYSSGMGFQEALKDIDHSCEGGG
jgi:hypothetical protein